MDFQRLIEIEARCEKATPNWKERELAMSGESLLQMGDPDRQSGLPFRSIQMRTDDARFAEGARQDVPDLCAEVRRLVDALREIVKYVDDWDQPKGYDWCGGCIRSAGYMAEEAIARYEVDAALRRAHEAACPLPGGR